MNKRYTLSLSRWHKVAERLAKEYSDDVREAKKAFIATTVPAWLGEGHEQQLEELAASAEARLERAFRLQDSIAAIRKALGDANASNGVTRELADHDRLTRRLVVLNSLLDGQSAELVGIRQLRHVPERLATDTDRYDRRPGIRVRLMSAECQARLQAQAESVQAEGFALADRISELNRAPLTLELPSDVAKAAGL